jgi:hypothetical protein
MIDLVKASCKKHRITEPEFSHAFIGYLARVLYLMVSER